MRDTSKKLMPILEELNRNKSADEQLDLTGYNKGQIESLEYSESISIDDALAKLKDLFGWRLTDFDIEKIKHDLS